MVAMALPAHVKPMLATAGVLPRDQDAWAFELKWDGIRALTYWTGSKLTLESRNLRDITHSWPELHGLGDALDGPMILDGEIVSLDDAGRPSFQRLQERMHVVRPGNDLVQRVPAAYFVFDVLHADGHSVMGEPWTARRERLEELGIGGSPCWATPPAFIGEGDLTVEVAEARQLEGVVAKRLDSTYVPGSRSKAWTKVKRISRNEFVVGGWTPGEGRREGSIGSLALGLPVTGGLTYVGNVGTGFTDKELRRLEGVLGPMRTDENPFVENSQYLKKGTVFVEPRLVTDVEYTERTNEGILRHPSYKGERIDKSPADVNTDLDISP
jgi:bifunctional non-homologous end joining protein LigD